MLKYCFGMLRVTRSQLLIIVVVLVFTVYFYIANRRQSRGAKIIENTVRSSQPIKMIPDLPLY